MTLTLTEFLLARIAEDEAVAREATPGTLGAPVVAWEAEDRPGVTELLIEPARVLAECEAKRRIVERFARLEGRAAKFPNLTSGGEVAVMRLTVMDLAMPYADHPDYRDEWRP